MWWKTIISKGLLASGMFFSLGLQAQLLVNQGQTIFVSGASLAIGGSATNNGTILNKGTITVAGDWLNQNTYLAGNGTFVLNGDVPQNVTHQSDSFHILKLQGTGAKTVLDEVQIINDLQFVNPGILSTAPGGSVVMLNRATITGANQGAYIEGLLYHEGIGKKIYPVGISNQYLPITLENITSDVNNPIIGLQLMEPNASATPGEGLTTVSQLRYAELKQKRGTLLGTPVTLSVGADEMLAPIQNIVVAESNTSNGIYRSLGQAALSTTAGQQYVTSNGIAKGSFLALALGEPLDAGSVYVPSAFSPRATNPEDQVIKVYGDLLSPDDFEFRVFSNWGNVLFESQSLKEMQTVGWKGVDKYTGDMMSIGAYTYSLHGKFYNGKSFKKSGSITLIK